MNKVELIEELWDFSQLEATGYSRLSLETVTILSVKRSNKEGVTGYCPRRGGSSFGSVSRSEQEWRLPQLLTCAPVRW